MSGAISLGAYEAGVVNQVAYALGRWNEARPDEPPRMVIDVIAGASAGAMLARHIMTGSDPEKFVRLNHDQWCGIGFATLLPRLNRFLRGTDDAHRWLSGWAKRQEWEPPEPVAGTIKGMDPLTPSAVHPGPTTLGVAFAGQAPRTGRRRAAPGRTVVRRRVGLAFLPALVAASGVSPPRFVPALTPAGAVALPFLPVRHRKAVRDNPHYQ